MRQMKSCILMAFLYICFTW